MTKWIIERRCLGNEKDDEDDAFPWERRRTGDTLQEAVWYYNNLSMYIQCHEQRLLDPDGAVVLHHRDQRVGGPVDLSPNALVAPYHNRMPVMLDPASAGAFVVGTADEATRMLEACPAEAMRTHRVSPAMNKTGHDGLGCITAVPL